MFIKYYSVVQPHSQTLPQIPKIGELCINSFKSLWRKQESAFYSKRIKLRKIGQLSIRNLFKGFFGQRRKKKRTKKLWDARKSAGFPAACRLIVGDAHKSPTQRLHKISINNLFKLVFHFWINILLIN